MKFSHKFLITNFLILVFVIIANILALKYFSSIYFNDYVLDIKEKQDNNVNVDFDLLSNILNTDILDENVINEYKKIIKDLLAISNSLEKFSQKPVASKTSLVESLKKVGIPLSSFEQTISTNAIQSFFSNMFDFVSLDLDAPEWIFVLKTLRSMVIFNWILIIVILLFSYIWISITFNPIKHVISNLSNIIHKKKYNIIWYKKRDEFMPLVDMINNLNKSLSIQEKIRTSFLSDLSHEIKTPITAVKCYLEWIEDWVINLDRKNIKLLHDEINRLIKITNLIMDYEKNESINFWDIFISKIDFNEVSNFVINEYLNELKKSNQKIIYKNTQNKFYINADKDKFTQILHNIFANFIKYAGRNTTLEIFAFHKWDYSYINFFDDWKWSPKNKIPFLKEKFYKIDNSRSKRLWLWVWIWLSIIDRIIKIHDWEFDIDTDINQWFKIKIKIPKI